MKKLLALCTLLFLCVSSVLADHPLIGRWRFRETIGGSVFENFVTIDIVNTKTKKVSGYLTNFPSWRLTGHYNGNIVFIVDNVRPYSEIFCTDYYMDGYYFTFQGTTPLKKHLGVHSSPQGINASWHSLSATKLSNLIYSNETMTLNDVLNQKMLKKQAQLRENMVIGELPK